MLKFTLLLFIQYLRMKIRIFHLCIVPRQNRSPFAYLFFSADNLLFVRCVVGPAPHPSIHPSIHFFLPCSKDDIFISMCIMRGCVLFVCMELLSSASGMMVFDHIIALLGWLAGYILYATRVLTLIENVENRFKALCLLLPWWSLLFCSLLSCEFCWR